MNEPRPVTGGGTDPDGARDYHQLPARVPLEDLITEQAASDPSDPEMGRDPNQDWLLRGV